MREAKFTKGPWVWQVDEECLVGPDQIVLLQDDEGRMEFAKYPDGKHFENAHLISAAPDMYEALQTAAGYIEGMLEDGCPRCGGDCAAANPPAKYCPMEIIMKDLAKAKVALAKAEGKT